MPFYLPNILLAIPRNPVTAVGLPLALGCLSGMSASKVENSNWYFVCLIFYDSSPLTHSVRAYEHLLEHLLVMYSPSFGQACSYAWVMLLMSPLKHWTRLTT